MASDARWWVPTQVELGAGIWRVPDLAGTTQRFDLHATPLWRADFLRTYVEGGIDLQHLSNGGIKEPNSGVNLILLNAAFAL